MVEKTDKPKKASGRSQAGNAAKPTPSRAAKKSARKADKSSVAASKTKKTAAQKPQKPRKPQKPETKKPAAKKGRKRAAKAVNENTSLTKEELAERRIAGGQDTKAAAPENRPSNGSPAIAAANDDVAHTTEIPESIPSGSASTEGPIEKVVRIPDTGKRGKTEPRARAGENAEGGPRPNTLVPTNGIHATQRRLKRKLHQNRGVMGLIAATLLGIIILGEQTAPPDTTNFDQEIAASQAISTYAGGSTANAPPGIIKPKLNNPSVVVPAPEASQVSKQQDQNLGNDELIEMERLLARLDLGPSTADGIVDNQTEAAIRLYQEIAGLPVDGAPSRTLLADMREVAKILEDGG